MELEKFDYLFCLLILFKIILPFELVFTSNLYDFYSK